MPGVRHKSGDLAEIPEKGAKSERTCTTDNGGCIPATRLGCAPAPRAQKRDEFTRNCGVSNRVTTVYHFHVAHPYMPAAGGRSAPPRCTWVSGPASARVDIFQLSSDCRPEIVTSPSPRAGGVLTIFLPLRRSPWLFRQHAPAMSPIDNSIESQPSQTWVGSTFAQAARVRTSPALAREIRRLSKSPTESRPAPRKPHAHAARADARLSSQTRNRYTSAGPGTPYCAQVAGCPPTRIVTLSGNTAKASSSLLSSPM
jgi:hypothetical protein